MTELKTKQIGIQGRGDQGGNAVMYIRQDVDGIVHVTVPAVSIHVNQEDLLKAITELLPMKPARHGGTF